MRPGWIWLLTALIYGCSAVLPHGESKVVSRWSSFAEAKAAYDQVMPYQTRQDALARLGFSPGSQPNVRILNHADLSERFLLLSLNKHGGLPPGLQHCMDQSDACYGYEIEQRETRDRRYGNFLADFFNFKRKTETTGWEFRALLIMVDDLVVYKLWGGTQQIHQYRDTTNPLGPLQGIGPGVVPRPEL